MIKPDAKDLYHKHKRITLGVQSAMICIIENTELVYKQEVVKRPKVYYVMSMEQ